MLSIGLGSGICDGGSAVYSPLIEAGLVAWYDFSDITTLFQDALLTNPVTADGQTILGVKDKSGLGHHLVTGNGCLYHAAGRNGRGTGKFVKASTHYFQAAFTLAQPAHIFAVVQEVIAASAGNETMFDGAAGGNCMRVYDAAAGTFHAATAADMVGCANTAGWMRFEALFNGASSHMSRDGGTVATGTVGAGANPNGITLNLFGAGGSPGDYEFGEIPVFNAAKDAAATARLLTYFAAKWGF